MKKFLVILFACLMFFSLSSCVTITSNSSDKTPTSVSNSTSSDPTSASNSTSSSNNSTNLDKITLAEQTVFDDEDIKISVKGMDNDSFWGPEIKLLVENNSQRNITVQIRDASINGFMISHLFSTDVASGKKVNDGINFLKSDLRRAQIDKIKDIEFYFHIFDGDTWETIVDSDVIKLTTSVESSFEQVYTTSGKTVYESNGIKITAEKMNSTESFWGAELYFYIENNSDKNITVQARDVSINGFMITHVFSADIVKGKKIVDTMTFFESDLEENGIEDITELELKFHIYNADNLFDVIVDTDVIVISFE